MTDSREIHIRVQLSQPDELEIFHSPGMEASDVVGFLGAGLAKAIATLCHTREEALDFGAGIAGVIGEAVEQFMQLERDNRADT